MMVFGVVAIEMVVACGVRPGGGGGGVGRYEQIRCPIPYISICIRNQNITYSNDSKSLHSTATVHCFITVSFLLIFTNHHLVPARCGDGGDMRGVVVRQSTDGGALMVVVQWKVWWRTGTPPPS